MYVDPKPLSTYGETQGWKMPSPQPTGTLKRPPILNSGSSSSSLSGMEQSIPSFQSFLKRTPPADQQKPLPPTPLRPRRPSFFDSGSSRPQSRLTRRSSSVYSRTISQWGPEPDAPDVPSWRSTDFADSTNLLLRPIAFSASTSQLLKTQAAPQLLEPRTYSPLITSPSPTASRRTTPSPEPRPSILLPPPPATTHVPKQHLRTVSLEKAKEIMQAPGVVHLLPEELRAQTLGKSRSHEPIRITSMDIFAGRTPPEVPPAASTLVDTQGRERLLSTSKVASSPTSSTGYPFPAIASPEVDTFPGAFHVGTGPIKAMAPIASQTRQASKDKAAQALGLDDPDEPRGRTKTRGPRKMSYEHYLPQKKKSDASSSSDELQSDAQKIAKEYHALLSEQYRQPSGSPASKASGSSTDVRTQMKMVPQPLFHSKPAARLPETPSSARGSESSVSPSQMRVDSGISSFTLRTSGGPFSLRVSTRPGSSRRRSTSGSIPISPPSASTSEYAALVPPFQPAPSAKVRAARMRANSDDNRVSAYYPHIMHRKPKKYQKAKGKGKRRESSGVPPVPGLLAADIIAQRLKTPEDSPISSPVLSIPQLGVFATPADAASDDVYQSSKPLHQRVLKGAAKYADKLKRSADSPSRAGRQEQSPLRMVATPESPHLLPSPSSGKAPHNVHLGWSDQSKSTFDKVRSSIDTHKHRGRPSITHIITPARPLDETRGGLHDPESPTTPSRSGSFFGEWMESWHQNKAEKRREELKKLIKVVTPAAAEEEPTTPISRRPSVFERRLSSYWM